MRLEVIGKSLSCNFRQKMETVCTDLLKIFCAKEKRNSMVASGEVRMEDLVCVWLLFLLLGDNAIDKI